MSSKTKDVHVTRDVRRAGDRVARVKVSHKGTERDSDGETDRHMHEEREKRYQIYTRERELTGNNRSSRVHGNTPTEQERTEKVPTSFTTVLSVLRVVEILKPAQLKHAISRIRNHPGRPQPQQMLEQLHRLLMCKEKGERQQQDTHQPDKDTETHLRCCSKLHDPTTMHLLVP